ncbi:MAG: IS3 family transposase, partial [Atopobiaceae bacterium]|nr:IS3 family transposase [Atopobiaceae bacterium]
MYDGKPVGWAISGAPDADLANSSLLMACSQLEEGQHPVCHTDGGCHYRWPGWKRICVEHGIVRS